MPLSTIYQLYRGGQFNRWGKPEYPEKTTHLPQFGLYIKLFMLIILLFVVI